MSSETPPPPTQLPKKELASVFDLCRKLNAERNFPELLKVMTQEAAKILQAESTSILIYDREHCELVSFVTLDGVPIRLDARLGIAGAALMNGAPLNVANPQEDSRFYAGIDKAAKKRTLILLAVPLQDSAG